LSKDNWSIFYALSYLLKNNLSKNFKDRISLFIPGTNYVNKINSYKNFFTDFDNNLSKIGVRSYGVGITTLEEVFLKIGHGEDIEKVK